MTTASLQFTASSAFLWRNSSRRLLLGSLGLNLFCIGVAIAMAVWPHTSLPLDRDVFARFEQLTATLPPADAALLRALLSDNREIILNTQTNYQISERALRETLRRSPFEIEALRGAMAKTDAARQNAGRVIQKLFVTAASQMSPTGRHELADRTPSP